jgi:enoyl-[acyl-carrier protein] reductase I
MTPSIPTSLQGKRGLVVGIANEASIAAGCGRAFVAAGAEVAATYLNDKARPYVDAVTDPLGCKLLLVCDVRVPGQLEEAFARIRSEWGQLDFLLHAIAFAPADDLHGRVVDCSAAGFAMAMDVSCHSFLSMARLAEPLMKAGGCLLTVTFYGSERVVAHYNLMGPVKAALESAVRYTAAELGPKGIRAHAISPGPIRTRAGSTASMNCSMPRRPPRRSTTWSIPTMSALSPRFSSVTARATLPEPSSPSMAGSI